MKRHTNFEKRPDFIQQLEGIGMNYWNAPSGPEKLPYWQEGTVYAFSETQVDRIQESTQELHNMCMEMVAQMVKSGDYPAYFKLNERDIPLIEQSWQLKNPSLYGRFDLVQQIDGSLKMLEYNGDTPVSILECSVAQWHYLEQIKNLPNGQPVPHELRTQYNLIDETLTETWQKRFSPGSLIHFAASGGFRHEDFGNLIYLMDNALRSGMTVKEIQMEQIGLTPENRFVDLEDKEIRDLFKLYPWEWITEEEFGKNIIDAPTRWMEPAWKMLLSNKAMLVKLWEMFPDHPLLLESHIHKPASYSKWAKKAIHGREGSNIFQSTFENGTHVERLAQGSHLVPEYDHWGYMHQKWVDIPNHDGYYPIIGSWIIGDQACGMSIREDKNLVTGNNAFFASHMMIPYDLEDKYSYLWK